jgi:hypothetical protein
MADETFPGFKCCRCSKDGLTHIQITVSGEWVCSGCFTDADWCRLKAAPTYAEVTALHARVEASERVLAGEREVIVALNRRAEAAERERDGLRGALDVSQARAEAAEAEGRRDYEDMRRFQEKFMAADHALRDALAQRDALALERDRLAVCVDATCKTIDTLQRKKDALAEALREFMDEAERAGGLWPTIRLCWPLLWSAFERLHDLVKK